MTRWTVTWRRKLTGKQKQLGSVGLVVAAVTVIVVAGTAIASRRALSPEQVMQSATTYCSTEMALCFEYPGRWKVAEEQLQYKDDKGAPRYVTVSDHHGNTMVDIEDALGDMGMDRGIYANSRAIDMLRKRCEVKAMDVHLLDTRTMLAANRNARNWPDAKYGEGSLIYKAVAQTPDGKWYATVNIIDHNWFAAMNDSMGDTFTYGICNDELDVWRKTAGRVQFAGLRLDSLDERFRPADKPATRYRSAQKATAWYRPYNGRYIATSPAVGTREEAEALHDKEQMTGIYLILSSLRTNDQSAKGQAREE